MSALTNHTIDIASCNGYGRCRMVSVWIPAVHEGQRVVLFSYQFMDEENTTSSAHNPETWNLHYHLPRFSGDGNWQIMHNGSTVAVVDPELLDVCREWLEIWLYLREEYPNIEIPMELSPFVNGRDACGRLKEAIAKADGK